MRAERDDDDFIAPPRKVPVERQRRLAYEIALGVFLGGLALSIANGVLWYAWTKIALGTLKFG